ncbi:hypothetical protein [Nocardia arthritidis]|uniref:Uncharacterized protein n=1 Tax=Nocardia arthritidis TaxID=228602 RepID=A0A6G9YGC2_9NOCA|nr:hypothetical protein [Nocardia arthritidis]QIS12279.1 hypothetical protein F5544_22085 [Nocardia arthritidis]
MWRVSGEDARDEDGDTPAQGDPSVGADGLLRERVANHVDDVISQGMDVTG